MMPFLSNWTEPHANRRVAKILVTSMNAYETTAENISNPLNTHQKTAYTITAKHRTSNVKLNKLNIYLRLKTLVVDLRAFESDRLKTYHNTIKAGLTTVIVHTHSTINTNICNLYRTYV